MTAAEVQPRRAARRRGRESGATACGAREGRHDLSGKNGWSTWQQTPAVKRTQRSPLRTGRNGRRSRQARRRGGLGANKRVQGTGRTHRAIVPDVGVFVVMPGRRGAAAQQKQYAQQRDDTGEGCEAHYDGVS